MKIKPKSAHNDFKTGFFGKFFFIIGAFLILFIILEKLISLLKIDDNNLGIILAFGILFIGIGLLIYFISCQFNKLSKIAHEVENDESLQDMSE